MAKLILSNLNNLTNEASALAIMAANNAALTAAMENTLSRDGTSPNEMHAPLDMNSERILNLPDPVSDTEPLRRKDLTDFLGIDTVSIHAVPTGGTTGQPLAKTGNADFAIDWAAITGTGSFVKSTSPALVTPNLGTPSAATLTNATGLPLASGVTGQLPLANGGTGANLADPNADRMLFWDDSAGGLTWLTAGTGLAISGTTLSSSGGTVVDVVAVYGIDNTGATNVASTLQTAITTIAAASGIVYLPAGIYNLGSSSLTLPDYTQVICNANAIIRRSADPAGANPYSVYTTAMISVGNYCRWNGGTLDNAAVLTTSTSSVLIGASGTKTFTVTAGLGLTTSTFLRMESRANRANHMEGTVVSYSGTTLVVGGLFASGSGTYTDWDICHANVYQSPMVLHGVTRAVVENVRVTGNWYVGICMDGWNPSTGGSLTVSRCIVRNCIAENTQNRGFYIYGNSVDCTFENCLVIGNAGVTDYGFNLNPANAVGTVNSQNRTKLIGCTVIGTSGQGITFADLNFYGLAESCFVTNMTNTGAVAFYAVKANGQVPQYNRFNNCIAAFCASGFYFGGSSYNNASGCSAIVCTTGFVCAPSAGTETQYINISGCEANSCTAAGFQVAGNSVRCSLNSIMSINNTTNGVQLDAGSVRTLVTGRSFNNTSANLSDAGTSSVTTGLTVA